MDMYQFVLAMILGCLRRLFAAVPSAFHRPGSDSGRDPEGLAAAPAIDLLALPGLAERECGRSDAVGSAPDAGASVGGCERAVEHGDAGHGHDRAHALRQPDGRPQELQPEEQGQEELPADADLHCRDPGVPVGRPAQRGPPSGKEIARHIGAAFTALPAGEEETGAGRFGLLLLGGGRGLRKGESASSSW